MNIYKLALRYFTHFKSFNRMSCIMSIASIAVGVSSIIISSSVMRGFEKMMIENTIKIDGHIRSPALQTHKNIASSTQSWAGQGILSTQHAASGVFFRSWSTNNKILNQKENENSQNIAVGHILAKEMNLNVGDTVSLTIAIMMNGEIVTDSYKCTVSKLINTGLHEYDSNLVVISWAKVRSQAFSVHYEFMLHDHSQAELTAKELSGAETWMERHVSLFNVIKTERRIVNLIFMVLLLVSGVSVYSNVQMILQTRIRNVFILRSLGMSNLKIKSIFVIIALIIAITGTSLGAILSIIIAFNSHVTQFIFESLYNAPARLEIPVFEMISVLIFHAVLCLVISIMPVSLDRNTLFKRVMRG